MFVLKSIILTITIHVLSVHGITWNGNWALGCDFRGNDLSNARTSGENCGGLCASTSGCTHFAWTNYNSGTCWMKCNGATKNDAFASSDPSAVCGINESQQPTTPATGGGGTTLYNVLATRHGARESGACALPKWNYNTIYPVALGDIPELQYLKFKPELCGHILTVDCGRGALDIVINNSNLGGGLDLYGSTWDILTGNQPPGQAKCSVKLSARNAMNGAGFVCFYKPGTDFGNQYYHNVGLLNTNDKIVTGAAIGSKIGAHRGANPYFAFDGQVSDGDQIKFSLNDGTVRYVTLRDCIYVGDEQIWS